MSDHGRLIDEFSVEECKDIICGGNPGSMDVFEFLANRLSEVNPNNFSEEKVARYWIAMIFDDLRLHDNKAWLLYRDICGEDVDKTLAVVLGCNRETMQKILNPASSTERPYIDEVARQTQARYPALRFPSLTSERKLPTNPPDICDLC